MIGGFPGLYSLVIIGLALTPSRFHGVVLASGVFVPFA